MAISILDLCVQAGFCNTRSEARKLCRQGAIRVNDAKVDEMYQVTTQDLRKKERMYDNQ